MVWYIVQEMRAALYGRSGVKNDLREISVTVLLLHRSDICVLAHAFLHSLRYSLQLLQDCQFRLRRSRPDTPGPSRRLSPPDKLFQRHSFSQTRFGWVSPDP